MTRLIDDSEARHGVAAAVRVALPADCDVRHVDGLYAAARDAVAADGDVTFGGERVVTLDVAAAQVLLVVRREVTARGRACRVDRPSDAMRAACRALALDEVCA